MPYHLAKIELCGFRGFPGKKEIVIDETLTLIYGGNRHGKSSILNAVEWCLFGSEVAGVKYGGEIRERKDWEVKNLNAPECYVRCIFRDRGKTLTAQRTWRSARTTVLMWQEGATQSSEQEKLLALLGISMADFVSAVHLHPEIVRKLMVAEPLERKRAIDRLLGLSELGDMVTAFTTAKPSGWTNALDQSKADLDQTLKTAFEEKNKTISSEGADLISAGFTEADLSTEGALAYAVKITNELAEFAATYQLPAPALTVPSDLLRLPHFRTQLSTAVQKLRNEHPVLADRSKHLIRKNTLDGLKRTYMAQARVVMQVAAALSNYPEKGSIDELNGKILAITKEIEGTDAEMTEVKRNAVILEKALAFFQDRMDGEMSACPLCGEKTRSVKEWREHIQQEIDTRSLAPLMAVRHEKTTAISALKQSKSDKQSLEERLADEKQRLAKSVADIQTAIGRTISVTDDPAAIADVEIASENAALQALQGEVASINAALDGFQQAPSHFDRFQRIGKAQLDIATIEAITENENYKELQAIRKECEQYAEDVERLIEGLNTAVNTEREHRLAAVQASISETFTKLTDRRDFPGLRVSVAGDGYLIELTDLDGRSQAAVPILNHGDMNCAALAIFLSLASSAQTSHKLGFVILDDPSQSLDDVSKKNLCSVLAKLCDSRQVIVATADRELREDVLHMTKHKTSYHLIDWTSAGGPVFETAATA